MTFQIGHDLEGPIIIIIIIFIKCYNNHYFYCNVRYLQMRIILNVAPF